MASPRLTLRLPTPVFDSLVNISKGAGFPTPSQLAKCALVQFVAHCESERPMESWIDDIADAEADRNDPTHRKRINERQ
ncbi:MAG: hypothetical protein K2M87_01285 [Muribaculaceae bacterium]|nr:hypothetical protein [Muribaculaceae bacterium]